MNQKMIVILGTVLAVVALAVGSIYEILNSQSHDAMQGMPSQSEMPNSSTNTSQSSEPVQTTKVDIKDFAFAPATIKVKVGDTVTWTNQDSARHDVVMDEDGAEGPSSELLGQNESYSYTFTKAGTYAYHCSPHPYMKATVIVEQ